MTSIINALDFQTMEHVWTIRVDFEAWERLPEPERHRILIHLRALARALGVTIEGVKAEGTE